MMRVRTQDILSATQTGTLAPEHLKALIRLCETDQIQEAEYAFKHLLDFFSDHPPLCNIGGVIYSRLGDHQQAVTQFQRSLELQPGEASTHSNLGNALIEIGNLNLAEQEFEKALEIAPDDVSTLSNLGRLMVMGGRLEEAQAIFKKSFIIAPKNTEIILNYANILIDLQHISDAVSMLTSGLKEHPDDWRIHKSLAVAHVRSQQHDAALSHYRTALALNPGVPEIEHMIDALSGTQRDRASARYVETLFDGFATSFDENLTGKLGYSLPEETSELLNELRLSKPVHSILDLGCGTGLLGPHVRDIADYLVGVDLSSKMLQRAAETGCYDKLVKADVHDFLASCKGDFDVIVALDVLIYVGEIDSLLAAAATCCASETLMVLSTEGLPSGDFALQPTGRYAHSDEYVDKCAARHGFSLQRREQKTLRIEQGQPVEGSVHVLCRLH